MRWKIEDRRQEEGRGKQLKEERREKTEESDRWKMEAKNHSALSLLGELEIAFVG